MLKLQGQDDQFLGNLNGDRFDHDSISNHYGEYGGRYSSTSILNPYCDYGGDYGNQSPWNKYGDRPPYIVFKGEIFCVLSDNKYLSTRLERISPKHLVELVRRVTGEIIDIER